MNTPLVVLIVCFAALVAAQEVEKEVSVAERRPEISNDQLRRILEKSASDLRDINAKANLISNSQKGIESKLKVLGQDVAGIGRLEDNLKKLERATAGNFQLTANSIKDLTASIRVAENKTDKAISSLARGQQEIKQVLVKVDQNQNRNERSLDELAKSVHLRLAGLDNLLKQSVLKELVTLVQTAKKLEQSQRHIESKVVRLDELTALTGITANKVQQLEHGLRSINSTQHRQLTAISQNVHQVGATTWQIDNKLGVLLSTQKNIERALVECKKCQPHHKEHHPHEHWPQPGYPQDYEPKESHKPESSYASPDEASYLYQLWYGKDDK